MKRMLRLAALAAAGAVLCVGCGSDASYRSAEETPVVLTVEGTDVNASQLAWQMEEGRQQMEGEYHSLMGQMEDALSTQTPAINSMWRDKELRGVLREYGTEEILKDFALDKLIAENHMKLTTEEEQDVQTFLNSSVDYAGGEAALAASLAQNDMTVDAYTKEYANIYYKAKVEALYYGRGGLKAPDDEKITDYYHNHYFHVQSVTLPLKNSDGSALSDPEKAAVLQAAEQIRSRLAAGESFSAIQSQHSQALGQTYEEYTIDHTADLPSAYISAASQLAQGETSQVVQDSAACYVLKCLPLDDSLLTKEGSSADGRDLLWNEISYKLNPIGDFLEAEGKKLDVSKHAAYYFLKNTNYQKYLV